ncbi:MAG: AAA family ATPase [Elusimicrobia bacterium]|nr:AAA family ATPase [Elusimicrobiota bacterium]
MVDRIYWQELIKSALKKRSIVWIAGIRRSGKTVLSSGIEGAQYFDCELPRVRAMLADPEMFLASRTGKLLILDEIHKLDNPSEILKIAHDHYPSVKIIATGSSTLWASAKFKDTLTGRKTEIWLTPMNIRDFEDFKINDLDFRLHRGGLPPFILAEAYPEKEYQEWMDSYWARDVQDLFKLEKRTAFLKFVELVFLQSGGIFEASKFAAPCEVSRATVANYLSALEATNVALSVRPFSSRASNEIITAPKVYGFDTGFLCFFRGWAVLRESDRGFLWEHLVLNEMLGALQSREINYWRDKAGHEIDFVLKKRGLPPIAIECRWKAGQFDTDSLRVFRRKYPEGENWVIASDAARPYEKSLGGFKISFMDLTRLNGVLSPGP